MKMIMMVVCAQGTVIFPSVLFKACNPKRQILLFTHFTHEEMETPKVSVLIYFIEVQLIYNVTVVAFYCTAK